MELNKKELFEIFENESTITSAARKYCEKHGIEYTDSIRRKCSLYINEEKKSDNDLENETETETNQYVNDKESKRELFTALNDEGKLMSIDEYCEYYGLEKDKIRSWKLVSHTGIPFFNLAFYENVMEPSVTEQELKDLIEEGLAYQKYEKVEQSPYKEASGTGVVKIADLHLGSYVDNLIRTKDFSIDILAKKLNRAAEEINKRNYELVHIHLLGDLLESFTGLNHKNSWKGLDKVMVGAEAVKLTAKVLHKDFLQRITNLGDVKLIAGNHDRVTSDNKEDVHGDAANLVGWGLELIGYSVEFNSLVLTHEVDGICHILTHGHHNISKKSTQQLCWDYGVQGKFNLICEGHLHSIIEKLSAKQVNSFQVIKDDAVDHRRMNCPSFFTGNFFSESLGYTSQSGFVIVEDNGEGIPNVFYYAV